MKVRYLLDTHTLIFFVLTPHKLGTKARKVFAQAQPGELAITSTTVAELGQLIHEDKIEFEGKPDDVFGPVLASLVQVPLSLPAALKVTGAEVDRSRRPAAAPAAVRDAPAGAAGAGRAAGQAVRRCHTLRPRHRTEAQGRLSGYRPPSPRIFGLIIDAIPAMRGASVALALGPDRDPGRGPVRQRRDRFYD